jgi:hypothetical protein
VLVTDPNTDRLSKSRTLSWTRDSLEGKVSSTIPASKLLESGKGLRIFPDMMTFVRPKQNTKAVEGHTSGPKSSLVNPTSAQVNVNPNKQKKDPTVQYHLASPPTTSPARLHPINSHTHASQ